MIMFKKTCLFMVLMLSLWMAFSVSFAAEAPYYDATYDAFYANGTDIVHMGDVHYLCIFLLHI